MRRTMAASDRAYTAMSGSRRPVADEAKSQ